MMPPVYVLANDKHLWLLRGLSYLFNVFWSKQQLVTVYGFNPPVDKLPQNFRFVSMGKTNAPVNQWSNCLIRMCQEMDQDLFVLLLEDFWFNAPVDTAGIEAAAGLMATIPNILRVDLSGNRAANKRAERWGEAGGYDLVSTPSTATYQMSFQAAIWNRDRLLEVLRPNEDPWQVEIEGTARLAKRPDLQVLGTAEPMVHYRPVYRARTKKMDLSSIPLKYRQFIEAQKWA